MTIRTRETPLSDELPSAQLYLEDLEEVVRVVRETRTAIDPRLPADEPIEFSAEIGNRICDTLTDLPKFGKQTNRVKIDLAINPRDYSKFWITLSPAGRWLWSTYGVPEHLAFEMQRKLEPIF